MAKQIIKKNKTNVNEEAKSVEVNDLPSWKQRLIRDEILESGDSLSNLIRIARNNDCLAFAKDMEMVQFDHQANLKKVARKYEI